MLAPCRVSASTLHASRSPTASTATCRGLWIPGTFLLLERIQSGVPLFGQQHAGVSGSQVRSYCWRGFSQESHSLDSNMQGSLDPRYAVIVGEDSVRSPTLWTATCRGLWIPGTLLLLERIQSGVPLFGQQHAGVTGSQVRSYCWRGFSQESHSLDSNMQGSLDPRYALIVGEDSVRSPTLWTATCENQWNNHYI